MNQLLVGSTYRNIWLAAIRLLAGLRPRDPAVAAPPAADLGRVLFERRGSGAMLYLGAGSALLLGALLLQVSPALCAASSLTGLALGAWGWRLGQLTFRCHERGVSQQIGRKTKALRHKDTSWITYNATRLRRRPGGSSIMLELVGTDGTTIRWRTHLSGTDERLDGLHGRILKMLAFHR